MLNCSANAYTFVLLEYTLFSLTKSYTRLTVFSSKNKLKMLTTSLLIFLHKFCLLFHFIFCSFSANINRRVFMYSLTSMIKID